MRDCRQALHDGLARALESDAKVILLGEDLVDPYGGAFKVTRGLSTAHPQRVIQTPISEAGFTGLATGLALGGWRPVVEIMFGDFTTLCVDQLVNHAAKFHRIYGIPVPLILRAPMGGRRGYGPTHSQSLETLFLGIDGLAVVSANELLPLDQLLSESILQARGPVLFVENKSMYGRPNLEPDADRIDPFAIRREGSSGRELLLSPCGFSRADLTIAAHGGMVPIALEAATALAMEDEIFAEVHAACELFPWVPDPLSASVSRTRALLTCEESFPEFGWGTGIAAKLHEAVPGARIARIGSRSGSIPAMRTAEERILPQVRDLVEAARNLLKGDTR